MDLFQRYHRTVRFFCLSPSASQSFVNDHKTICIWTQNIRQFNTSQCTRDRKNTDTIYNIHIVILRAGTRIHLYQGCYKRADRAESPYCSGGTKKKSQLSNIKSFMIEGGLKNAPSCGNPTGPSRWHNIAWNMRTVPTPPTANTAHKGAVCEGRTGGGSKRKDGMFQGVSGTLQATGYKRVSIILSKLQECTAWNKHAQITHYSVWYINSHFLAQTKKEKRKKKKNLASHWKWDS